MSEQRSGSASHRRSASGAGSSQPFPELGYELRRAPRIVDMAPWLVVGCGVGAMIFLFVAATSGLPGTRPGDAGAGARPGFSPEWPFGPGTGQPAPDDTVSAVPTPVSSVSPAPAVPSATATAPVPIVTSSRRAPTTPPTRPRPTTPPPAAPAEVTGRYRVLASYHDSFIGEVLVANGGSTGRQWTVEIRFPDNVGRLRTSWVESAPQASLRRSGDWYIFTSTFPVGARSSVPLRFHFDRSGRGETPAECRANGTRCTIA